MADMTKKISIGQTFITGLWKENPVLRLLLGMCPTLAVTTTCKNALTMGLSAMFVLTCSNVVVSLMRNLIKPHLRILMFTLTISTFVTIVDLFLKAFFPDMSESLGPFIPLIIVNCMIIGRAEACASKQPVMVSIIDAWGMGTGFTAALLALAAIREILSAGTLFDVAILQTTENGGWFTPWTAMQMPVGAFITLGLLIGLVNIITRKKTAATA